MQSRTGFLAKAMVYTTLAVISALLGACGDDDDDKGEDITIAWIPKDVQNNVFWAGREGAFLKARELTSAGPDKVTILYDTVAPATATLSDQLPVVLAAVAQKVDGIGLSATDATGLNAAIDAAVAAGVKVMTWDSDAVDSDRFTYLGVSNNEGGQVGAELLAKALVEVGKTTGKIAILSGNSGAANLNERVEGFRARLATVNTELGTSFTADLADVYYCNDDGPLSVRIVEAVMGGTPVHDDDGQGNSKNVREVTDLAGWFFAGSWPLFESNPDMTLLPLWQAAAANNVLTVAFDTLPQELEYMRGGYVRALIGQKYWGWGYDTVQMLYNMIKGTQTYDTAWTDSGIDIICTDEGRAVMSQMWTSYDFTAALPACDLLE